MANYDPEIVSIVKRLQNARLDLMRSQPFYALLLMHMKFALDVTCETAYTDGRRIAFNPDFLKELDNEELQFVLMHEVLHVVLQHCFRRQSDYDPEVFDIACDIIVNSNIMHSFGDDKRRITMRKYGEMIHKTPKGEEGYLYSVEEVYAWVLEWLAKLKQQQIQQKQQQKNNQRQNGSFQVDPGEDGSSAESGDGESSDRKSSDGQESDGSPAGDGENTSDGKDNEKGNGDGDENSSSSDADTDAQGGGVKGRKQGKSQGSPGQESSGGGDSAYELPEDPTSGGDLPTELPKKSVPSQFDDHSFWDGDDEEHTQRTTWLSRMVDATQIIRNRKGGFGCGSVPAGVQREIDHLTESQLDWKAILIDFVQEEINDYSFSPPDRRFDDSPFFLPDYNEKDEHAEDILFMIDTSGSMSDNQIIQCYSEIKGAIDQFDGKLQGWLGFFDAKVIPPIPFTNEEEFKIIRPYGGGGTSFQCVLDYVRNEMEQKLDKLPASIIFLTDGFAPWPDEKDAMDIPVLWLINNEQAEPPWGKVARIPPEKH